MCLETSKTGLEKFLAEHKGKKTITAYKAVVCEGTGSGKTLVSYWHPEFKWQRGVNRSDNKVRRRNIADGTVIFTGIHVYLRRDHVAKGGFFRVRSELRVQCDLADLLGVDADLNHAVFHKVTVTDAAYDAAIGKRKRKAACQKKSRKS